MLDFPQDSWPNRWVWRVVASFPFNCRSAEREAASHLLIRSDEHESLNRLKGGCDETLTHWPWCAARADHGHPRCMAQQRRGNGGAGQGRGSNGIATQTRTGNQDASQTALESRRKLEPKRELAIRVRLNRNEEIRVANPLDLLSTNTSGPDLLRMREEEKLARDVYTSLAKTSKLTIFRNISRAESQHMQSVERLIRARWSKWECSERRSWRFRLPRVPTTL